jgi:Molybdopterin oxidoreductase Fe4S4 domain
MWRIRSGPQTTYRPKGSNHEVEAHHSRPGRGVCPRLVRAAAIRRRRPDPRGRAKHDVATAAAAARRGRYNRHQHLPYCAVGCAQLVYAKDGHVIHIEGDPRSPINQGTLCPKGAATFGWLTSPDRLTKVLYRAPRAESWEERPLGWAMDRIAYLVKRTRDESFVSNLPDGTPVNHTLAIGSLGAPPSTMRKITSSRNCSAAASAWFG